MLKTSKIKHMRGERGLASVVVVTVLTVVITLVSLGFARLMDRSVSNSQNNQASSIATYAAQSAINDVASYIKNNPLASSSNCSGEGSLIGSATQPGPFYSDSNLSGDTGRSTRYSCLLVDLGPKDLVYQQLPPNKSQVIKMTTSASPGELDRIMFSWQPTSSQITGYPPSPNQFFDETTWNGLSRNYLPVLRLTLYPVPTGGAVADLQARSKTVFLYPQSGSAPVPVQSYSALSNGALLPVGCSTTVGAGTFNGSADYVCNIIISNLTTAASPEVVDYFYVRLMPVYNQADVKIKANDLSGQLLKFLNIQAVVDATAQSAGVAKRLQARIDISSSSAGDNENIAPTDDLIPDYSLRSAGAICKRLKVFDTPYSYVAGDGPPALCNQFSGISTPAPTLRLSINGIDSETPTPSGSSYKGVSYIGAGSSATVSWTSTDAAYNCNASDGWSGDKNSSSSWSGSTGTGSQTFSGITVVTRYSLQCSGPGGTTPTKTVTAWPPPTLSFSADSPSVPYNSSTTLRWSATNATSCLGSGGTWGSGVEKGLSGTESTGNLTTAQTYTLKCSWPGGADISRGVTVSIDPPTFSFSADSTSLSYNSSTTLRWTTSNVTWCWGSGGTWGSGGWKNPAGGSDPTGNLTSSQTYTLQCGQPARPAPSQTVTITVTSPPPENVVIRSFDFGGWANPDTHSASFNYNVLNAVSCYIRLDFHSTIDDSRRSVDWSIGQPILGELFTATAGDFNNGEDAWTYLHCDGAPGASSADSERRYVYPRWYPVGCSASYNFQNNKVTAYGNCNFATNQSWTRSPAVVIDGYLGRVCATYPGAPTNTIQFPNVYGKGIGSFTLHGSNPQYSDDETVGYYVQTTGIRCGTRGR